MTLTLRSILFLIFSAYILSFGVQAAEKVTAILSAPGVIEVKSKFETKTATVTFDPKITNIETLIKATTNAGYPSTLKK